jgi:hypothetical protein
MMNHPVGNRYVDSAMPLAPNSRSDGSMEASETVSVTTPSFWSIPALAEWRTAAVILAAHWRTYVYFYYFKH